jgi:hypothetical protein
MHTSQTFVELFRVHDHCTFSSKKAVEDRDISKLQLRQQRSPEQIYAFRFSDVLSTEVEHDDKRVTLTSEPINESTMYYLDCKLYNAHSIKKLYPNGTPMFPDPVKGMSYYGTDRWVYTRNREWIPVRGHNIALLDSLQNECDELGEKPSAHERVDAVTA